MPGSVLITGTTSGVGRALLEHYAGLGVDTIAVNRRPVPPLASAHPQVRYECVDVRDGEAVRELMERLAATQQLPEVLFLNAGINAVDNDDTFDSCEYKSVLQTNLFGALHFIDPLTKLPPSPVRRHIVAIGSMASYVGNPYALGYSTSKLALSACFDAWSKMYAGTDLVFQLVTLGPVPTEIKTMERRFPRWIVKTRDLFSGDLTACVEAITRFAETDKKTLVVPRRAIPLYLGLKVGTVLIPGFFRGKSTLAGEPRRRKNTSTPEPGR